MRCVLGNAGSMLSERVTNRSGDRGAVHLGPSLRARPAAGRRGRRAAHACRTIITPPEPWEDTARLEPGQRSAWPMARRRGGGEVDLSRVPGPEAASHDDVFLTGLDGGWAEVAQPALGLAFRLEWDPAVSSAGSSPGSRSAGPGPCRCAARTRSGSSRGRPAATSSTRSPRGSALRLAGHAPPGNQAHRQLPALLRAAARAYCAVKPPSTTRLCPVIQALSSDSRNTAGPAMSSGCPIRRSGSRAAIVVHLIVEVGPVYVRERGRHHAGGQRVDPDPGRPEVDGQRPHERLDPALGRAVARVARRGHLGQLAADEHDRPAAGHHLPQARPGQPEARVEVEVRHPRPLLVGGVAEVLLAADHAGRVHQAVELAEGAHRGRDAFVRGRGIAQVGRVPGDRPAGPRRGGANQLGETRLVPAGGQHPCAFHGAAPRYRVADSRRGPGDEHRTLLKPSHKRYSIRHAYAAGPPGGSATRLTPGRGQRDPVRMSGFR